MHSAGCAKSTYLRMGIRLRRHGQGYLTMCVKQKFMAWMDPGNCLSRRAPFPNVRQADGAINIMDLLCPPVIRPAVYLQVAKLGSLWFGSSALPPSSLVYSPPAVQYVKQS